MPVYIKYYPVHYNKKEFLENLAQIKKSGFDGVLLPASRSADEFSKGTYKQEFLPISRMVEYARLAGLKTGVILSSFHSARMWERGHFFSPVSQSGANMVSDNWYHPVCPNNPDGQDRFYSLLEKMERTTPPDLFYIDYLRFPFDWLREELDVQHHLPPFCYCPFCVGEFSSVVGEIVHTAAHVGELLPDWLGWRTTSILNLFFTAKNYLAPIAKMVISTPPLSLIDLPFTTGQLPVAFASEGTFVSPLLYHRQKRKSLDWAEDLLDQYTYDINQSYINPTFEVGDAEEFQSCLAHRNRYEDIFFYHWDIYKKLMN